MINGRSSRRVANAARPAWHAVRYVWKIYSPRNWGIYTAANTFQDVNSVQLGAEKWFARRRSGTAPNGICLIECGASSPRPCSRGLCLSFTLAAGARARDGSSPSESRGERSARLSSTTRTKERTKAIDSGSLRRAPGWGTRYPVVLRLNSKSRLFHVYIMYIYVPALVCVYICVFILLQHALCVFSGQRSLSSKARHRQSRRGDAQLQNAR